jgi:hypothetical protein
MLHPVLLSDCKLSVHFHACLQATLNDSSFKISLHLTHANTIIYTEGHGGRKGINAYPISPNPFPTFPYLHIHRKKR